MSTIIHIALTPADAAKVTPLEILEDFADATPTWHYLEEDSRHYAEEKGVPACVLRYQTSGSPHYIDFAFAADEDGTLSDMELVLIDAPTPETKIEMDDRNAILDRFIDHLQGYLQDRPDHVALQVDTADVDAVKKRR
jgi:hypothetical protein